MKEDCGGKFNMNFKDKKEPVMKLIFGCNLNFTDEDKQQLQKLIDTYFRKKTGVANSKIENIAGGLLWVYSRINFLFQNDERWSQKNLSVLLNLKSKTISRMASQMMDSLRIDYFDSRFAREEVAEKDPRNNFFMTKEGFIVTKDDIKEMMFQRMKDKFGDLVELEQTFTGNKETSEECKKKLKQIQEDKDQSNKNKKLNDFFK